jgi:glycine/D-amino acid oxidase-like deaminating enzyme
MNASDPSAPLRRTLWWATAVGRPQTHPLTDGLSVDVAVVGGGFLGMTAAWRLAAAGMSVAVLEAGPLGGGASGLNAGFVVPNFAKADPAAVVARLGEEAGGRLLRAVGAGADRVFDTIRANDIACEAEQAGWIHVAHRPEMADVLRARAAAWAALGRPVRFMEADEARTRTAARLCHGALFDASAGMLNPLGYLWGLARLAIGAGARVIEGASVADAVPTAGGWRLRVGDRSVAAKRVLLCTNAFTGGLAGRLGRGLIPLQVYQLATEPLAEDVARRVAPMRNPLADTRANLFTCRLDAGNRLISGGMAVIPFAADGRMAREIAGRLATELGLDGVPRVDFVWRGVAAVSPDWLAHLYEIGEGFYAAMACNGRGIAVTAVVAHALADLVLGRPAADLPLPVGRIGRLPLRLFAAAAPSVAIFQAKMQDRMPR